MNFSQQMIWSDVEVVRINIGILLRTEKRKGEELPVLYTKCKRAHEMAYKRARDLPESVN